MSQLHNHNEDIDSFILARHDKEAMVRIPRGGHVILDVANLNSFR